MGELKPCVHFSSWCCLYETPPARCFGFCGFVFFLYSWYQKYFFCDSFSLSVLFKKQMRIPTGKAPCGTMDVKFITFIWPCCSTAPARCFTAQADPGSHERWESVLGVLRLLLTRGDGKYEHPRSRTCNSTSNGIQWVCCFVLVCF